MATGRRKKIQKQTAANCAVVHCAEAGWSWPQRPLELTIHTSAHERFYKFPGLLFQISLPFFTGIVSDYEK